MAHLRESTLAAVAGFGVAVLLATPSFAAGGHGAEAAAAPVQLAHMSQGQSGQGNAQPCPMGMMGRGMMTPGTTGQGMMGSGMMGGGMKPGMGGQGMPGPGMRGQQGMTGPGFGTVPGLGEQVMPSKHLTADDVRHFLEHRLEMHGNKRLQVGEVQEADEDRIVADITTVDGSLVQRLEVDRHTGQMRHAE